MLNIGVKWLTDKPSTQLNFMGDYKMLYLANAFSLQMLSVASQIETFNLSHEVAAQLVKERKHHCVIGHSDTAMVVGIQLGVFVMPNRESIKLHPGDAVLVAQVVGGRLPEGATELPEGIRIEYILVKIMGTNTSTPTFSEFEKKVKMCQYGFKPCERCQPHICFSEAV
jgi:hypothetical protein